MATKRIIQLPTLNNWQVTWGNSSQAWYLRKLPNELPWGDWPNPKRVIQTPQTDANGNITGWRGKKTVMNSPEEPEVWTYKWNNGVVQTIDKRAQQGWQPATTYGSKTDKAVAVMSANKNGTTSSLPQATPANLPWVTKYAGIDKNYWNNQAGIDLVNKQSELDTLPEAEKAQRLAGAYNPTPPPTVATTQNPVIKKTLDKPQEQTVTPAVLQGADINTLNSTLDELNYKVNVEGKALSKDEYLVYASAKRQLQDMMKPQALTGGLDSLITNKENEIKQVTDESKINNEQELADFTRSQEVYKQAEVDAIEQADAEQKKTLWYILWWQWAWQGTFAVEQIGKITQNSLAKKQALNEAVQAKIDLYGSQLRKDSQQTIQAMKDRLDSYYMKAAEFDVDNIKQMNEYNAKEWASKIEQIDKMMALAQSQAMAMQPLTEQEKAQAQAFAGNLYDNEWNFQNNVFEMLYKVNPKLANAAVMQGTAIQKERLSNDLAMRWLDADIKRAQLNKLLNPDVDYKVVANDDWTYTRTWSDWSVAIVDPSSWTDIWWLSWADLAKTLASWKIDWKKFFGVYATGDPDGKQFASIYNKAAEQWLDAYMKSRQDRWSKITVDMVNQASIATGVDPITIAAKMAQDSWMGTQGKGARNNNPWNVGQFDSLDAKWITVKGYPTLAEWVLAVAENFRKRQDALLSVAPQKKSSADVNKIYQILTEAGQADWVAKNNAKTLASSWKTIEQIQQEYPNKDDQYRIRDVTDSVSKAYESFNKSNTKLDSIMRILKDPNASGKSIEVALKSFVSAIDNTAAMAWEVAQARDAWLSDIDALQARLLKIGSWKVKDSIKKDIENTISQFHQWIQWAYDDYFDIQQWSLKTQYWDTRADKLNLYRRQWSNQSQVAWQISSDRK